MFSHDLIPIIKQSPAFTMGHREFPRIRSYEKAYNPTASFNLFLCSKSWQLVHLESLRMCSDRRGTSVPLLLKGGWFHLGQRLRDRLLVARVMELLNVKLEA